VQDLASARLLFERAARAGSADAAHNLATFLLQYGDSGVAAAPYNDLALTAQSRVLGGVGGLDDNEAAMTTRMVGGAAQAGAGGAALGWLKLASRSGHSAAALQLGALLLAQRREARSLRELLSAASAGSAAAAAAAARLLESAGLRYLCVPVTSVVFCKRL
jgi:TPR repeat protein